MGTYDDILQLVKEAEGSSDHEQMLAILQDSFGETVRDFCSVRQYVMDIATLPDASLKDIACGSPPFVIEDGETNYAVIWPDGKVKPLPIGFEVAEDELNVGDDTILMNTLAPSTPSGLIRYVPIKEEFEIPDDDAFELERIIDLAAADRSAPSGSIQELKETALNIVDSEAAKIQMAELIEQLEGAAGDDTELLEQLLQSVIEQGTVSKTDHQADMDKKVPLVEATMEGDGSEIARLLEEGAEGEIGAPAFVYAILANQPEAFEVHVEHGINVSKLFDWDNGDGSIISGANAIILAAAGGNMWAVQRLLELGVDPNFETAMGQTALEVAVAGGQEEVVDILFDKVTDVQCTSAGRVLVAAAIAGNTDIVSRCLEAGIPVDSTDSRDWTALKYAISNGDLRVAELLFEYGADCNIADDEGWTPLINAVESRDVELVDLLLSNGADPNSAPDVEDENNEYGFSALMRAAHYGEAKILESLITAGADQAQTDSDGAAAVHYAALHRHPDCLKILLNNGADPNNVGVDGHSPVGLFLIGLVTTVQDGAEIDQAEAIETLKILIKNGADWHEGADKIVANVAEADITVLDAARFAIEQEGLKKLSKAIDQLE